jgi:hypothetical protein
VVVGAGMQSTDNAVVECTTRGKGEVDRGAPGSKINLTVMLDIVHLLEFFLIVCLKLNLFLSSGVREERFLLTGPAIKIGSF